MTLLLLALACTPDLGLTPIAPEVTPPDETAPPTPYIATAREQWEQDEEVADVDIYALVDRSCSMTHDDAASVVAALRYLLLDLDMRMLPGAQWSLTLATTDQVRLGTLPSWTRTVGNLDPATLDEIERAVYDLPRVGGEQGMASAVMMALDPRTPDIAVSDLYLIITDEDDQSYPPPGWSFDSLTGQIYPSDFAAWLLTQGADALYIVPTYSGCGWYSPRYQSAVDAGGGRIVDFCSQWGGALSQQSWATAVRDSWTLAHDPIPGTLRVFVDGAGTAAWTLDGRTLTLHSPPGRGSIIEVVYEYWSL